MEPVNLVAGGVDPWYKTKVKALVIQDEGKFWVWLVENEAKTADDVWWRVEGTIPQSASQVIVRMAQLEAIPVARIQRGDADAFRLLLGNAIGRALDGDVSGAQVTLDYAASFVKSRLEEAARRWYLVVALWAAGMDVVVLVATFFIACGGPAGCGAASTRALYCIGMGLLGACVSLISRTGTFSTDPAAGRSLHTLEALARIGVGAIAGFIAFLGIRVGLIAPKFTEEGAFAFMLIAFAAGYSERFIAQVADSLDGVLAGKGKTPPPPPPPPAAPGPNVPPPQPPALERKEPPVDAGASPAKPGPE